jgi:nicotinamidase-related amidase
MAQMPEQGKEHTTHPLMPSPERCFVLLVDFQERLLNAVGGRAEVVLRAARLLMETAKAFGLPVVHTEQYPKGLGRTHPVVSPQNHYGPPLEKLYFSVWKEQHIRQFLQSLDRDEVIMGGIEAHVCVLQSALDMLENGYKVWVAADAVASRDHEQMTQGLRIMEKGGACLTTSEIVAFWFLKRSATDAFRHLSGFLK